MKKAYFDQTVELLGSRLKSSESADDACLGLYPHLARPNTVVPDIAESSWSQDQCTVGP